MIAFKQQDLPLLIKFGTEILAVTDAHSRFKVYGDYAPVDLAKIKLAEAVLAAAGVDLT